MRRNLQVFTSTAPRRGVSLNVSPRIIRSVGQVGFFGIISTGGSSITSCISCGRGTSVNSAMGIIVVSHVIVHIVLDNAGGFTR